MSKRASKRSPATPEEIWAILREITKAQRETAVEMEKTDRLLRENALQMKETERRLRRAEGMFTSQWGKLMEALVEGDLLPLLRTRGVDLKGVAQRVSLQHDPRQREIDLLAWNGEEVVAVEVKTTLKVAHVRRFVDLLEDLQDLMPPRARREPLYGAVAYLKAEQASAVYAERAGLFVIRAVGSSASLLNRADFGPRAFGGGSEASGAPYRAAPP